MTVFVAETTTLGAIHGRQNEEWLLFLLYDWLISFSLFKQSVRNLSETELQVVDLWSWFVNRDDVRILIQRCWQRKRWWFVQLICFIVALRWLTLAVLDVAIGTLGQGQSDTVASSWRLILLHQLLLKLWLTLRSSIHYSIFDWILGLMLLEYGHGIYVDLSCVKGGASETRVRFLTLINRLRKWFLRVGLNRGRLQIIYFILSFVRLYNGRREEFTLLLKQCVACKKLYWVLRWYVCILEAGICLCHTTFIRRLHLKVGVEGHISLHKAKLWRVITCATEWRYNLIVTDYRVSLLCVRPLLESGCVDRALLTLQIACRLLLFKLQVLAGSHLTNLRLLGCLELLRLHRILYKILGGGDDVLWSAILRNAMRIEGLGISLVRHDHLGSC